MSKPREYWFHEDDNCSEEAAKQHNGNAQTGEHKHKWRCFVEKSEADRLAFLAESYRLKLASLLCGISIKEETATEYKDCHLAYVDKDDLAEARAALEGK